MSTIYHFGIRKKLTARCSVDIEGWTYWKSKKINTNWVLKFLFSFFFINVWASGICSRLKDREQCERQAVTHGSGARDRSGPKMFSDKLFPLSMSHGFCHYPVPLGDRGLCILIWEVNIGHRCSQSKHLTLFSQATPFLNILALQCNVSVFQTNKWEENLLCSRPVSVLHIPNISKSASNPLSYQTKTSNNKTNNSNYVCILSRIGQTVTDSNVSIKNAQSGLAGEVETGSVYRLIPIM